MDVADVRELRQLRQENARLKKVLAERDLEVEVMKELQAKSGKPAGTPPGGADRMCAWAESSSSGLALQHRSFRDKV